MDERFAHDRFLVDQLVRPMINLYRVTPLAAGETPAGGPVAYVRQKRMAIKEDIRFYADENESQEVFRIKARSMFDTDLSRDYEAATSFGLTPRSFYDAGVAGALCDEETRARLRQIGDSFAWPEDPSR